MPTCRIVRNNYLTGTVPSSLDGSFEDNCLDGYAMQATGCPQPVAATRSRTLSKTSSLSSTRAQSVTATRSRTLSTTLSPSRSGAQSVTATRSRTLSKTLSPSRTRAQSVSNTRARTLSATASRSSTRAQSVTATRSRTLSKNSAPSSTRAQSVTATPSIALSSVCGGANDAALMALYTSAGGSEWRDSSGWPASGVAVSCSTYVPVCSSDSAPWYGVYCSGSNVV
jgi:hypothetical protein